MDSDTGDYGHSIPEVVVRASPISRGGSYSVYQNPSFGAFDPGGGIMGIPSGFNPGAFSWTDPIKPEAPTETKAETKEKDERSWREKRAAGERPVLDWFRDKAGEVGELAKKYGWDFVKNALLFNPQTRPVVLAIDAFKAFQEGGPGGIMGALGQTAMQKVFGKNLDVARGIYGAISGDMTPGQALGRVALSRGMKMGINNLMKNIYGQWGMDGVRLAMPMIQTALQGQGKGKGPGGP